MAVRRLRQRFLGLTLAWVTTNQDSPGANQAYAIALAVNGNPAALAAIERAQQIVGNDKDWSITLTEIWLRLAYALPNNIAEIEKVFGLAMKALATPPNTMEPPLERAALAALVGRVDLAIEYASKPQGLESWDVPSSLGTVAPELLIRSALGGPKSLLDSLNAKTWQIISTQVPTPLRSTARARWLARSATLAFPFHRLDRMDNLTDLNDYLLNIQSDWYRGERDRIQKRLDELRDARRYVLASTLTFDGLYPEADLWKRIGMPVAAADWLDPALRAISQMVPEVMATPVGTLSLVQAMALRAEVAWAVGDSETWRAWSRAVSILWQEADLFARQNVAVRVARLGS